jgi:serine/threonine protein kinase
VSDHNTSNSTRSKDPLIGKQLGDYRITSRLASGGMARVYKAMDYKLQRPAAVKVLESDKFEHDQTIATRFKREARAVAALEHDNIITIYQYGEDETEGVYFLAMKLVKGKDLAEELRRIRRSRTKLMELDRVLKIMEQVAAALDYAHSEAIVHRDVKPSNILLDKDDKAILTDLGLVLRANAETTMGTAFGTPRYIAPEQATSSDKAVPQSDIYSLAVIFYELLTGQTPFDGESPMEIALAHISDPPPSLRDINPEIPYKVEDEILKALEKDPNKRHRTATELIDNVKKAYGMGPKPAEPASVRAKPLSAPVENDDLTLDVVSVAERPTRAETTPRRPTALLALVLLALVIAAAFVVNGVLGSAGMPAAVDGAPIALIYDEATFTIINQGDYQLDVKRLEFIRGRSGDRDDFSGDRIPRDVLPAQQSNCFQILLSTGTNSVPPLCRPIAEHRHGSETLVEPMNVHWRTEAGDSQRIATFEVRYGGQLITRCDTVARGQTKECYFTWPVPPPALEE